MKLIKEFQSFAIKGNMIDTAIGIVIGASFKSVVDIIVKKIITPPLSILSDGVSLADKKIMLRASKLDEAGKVLVNEVSIGYGALIEGLVDFLIIGLTLFIVVKVMNKLREQAVDTKNTKVATPKDIELLSRIVDLLEEQNKDKNGEVQD